MTSETAALAALLVAGHTLGDFVFQTTWMIDRKAQARGLLAHVGVVLLAQAVLLLPFRGGAPVLAAVGIATIHLLIDITKGTLSRRVPQHGQLWFVLDQGAHLAVLAVAWKLLAPGAALRADLPLTAERLYELGVLVTLVAVNVNGVSAWVGMELARWKLVPEDGSILPAGRVIGVLERLFVIVLILLNHWEALGLLVAAKSLARFRDLDDPRRAEYYLVGTLISLLAATVTTLVAQALLAASFGPA